MTGKELILLSSVLIIFLFSILSFEIYTKSNTKIEMAKAGLQQCIEHSTIIWRKDCGK